MKKLLLSFFALASLWFTLPCQAQTYDFSAVAPSGQTLYYKIGNAGEVSVVHPNSTPAAFNAYISGALTIPDSIFYNNIWYSVTSIGYKAFLCSSLTSVTIPYSVTTICDDAFYSCSSLTSITIPYSVTSIGYAAFSACSSLISMNVSPGNPIFDSRDSCNAIIKTISNTLIAGCKNTTIPNSVTSIGDSAFYSCSSLTSITIPNSVISIGDYAFSLCSSLTSVTIPNSVTSIGYNAFYHCYSLTSVTIPNSVTSIGYAAFHYCSSLTSVTIPNSVTSIGNYTFSLCSSLTSVTIPNSVTSIGYNAFYHCSSLTSITIPNTVTSIGNGAFYSCSFDTVNVFWNFPITLENNNSALTRANVINIPCGTTSNYQTAWGTGNYQEPEITINLTVNSSDENQGLAAIVPQNGHYNIQCDSTAVIQATSNFGYHFTQWNDGNTDNPRTVTLTQDTSFTAFFEKNQYTLMLSSNDNSIGIVTGSGTYEYLDEVPITATTTAPHHHFVGWSDGANDALRTIIITEDLSLIAIFAIDTHHVSLMVNNENYGHVDGIGYYPYGSTALISATAHNGYYFREWDNGTSSPSFTFTVTGDTAFTALFAPEIIPSICMVTVENDHNLLLWEKEQTITGYNVYREGNTSGVYELLASVPYDSLSTWVDTSSRPRTRSYRYRLSAIDIYGHEADLSDIHKTMHLTIGQGLGTQWNLVWTEYEGADYTTYVIYRGTDPSNIQLIDVMPSGGNTTYTDVSAPAGNIYYQVGIMLTTPCNPTKSENIVLSNIATNVPLGISDVVMSDLQVFAHDGQLVVSGECHIKDLQVFDISGKLLKTVKVDGNNIFVDISDFSTGVYFVRTNTEKGPVTRKVVR